MNLTFEQLELSLHKWANHFQNEKYEHGELINAVWVMGRVQKLHINLASRRIKYDMIEYMRTEENFKRRKRDEANGVFVPKLGSLSFLIADDVEFGDIIEDRKESYGRDTEDYFNWIVRGLNKREKLLVKLYFIDGFTLKETGKIIGFTESRASQVLKDALVRIRHKLCIENPDLKDVGRGPIVPRRNSLEYNRAYYQANKARISFNRRRRRAG